MTSWFRKYPVICWSFVAYLVVSGLAFASSLSSGPFAYFLFVWPYLFILALEGAVGPATDAKLLVGLVVGLIGVGATGVAVQQVMGRSRPEGRLAIGAGLLVVLITIVALTGGAFVVAGIAGWPVGE